MREIERTEQKTAASTSEATQVGAEALTHYPAAGQQPLDTEIARSLAWTGAAKWGAQLLVWSASLILARLLSPEDYGLFGMATLYLGLAALVSESGIGQTVISLRDLSEDQISQLAGFSLSLGVLFALLSCALAAPLGTFFRTEELPALVMVMSVTFVLAGLQTVPEGLLRKERRFRLLAQIEVIRSAVQAIVTVILAFAGFRYWSLAIGGIVAPATSLALVQYHRGGRLKTPNLKDLRQAIAFSIHVLGSRIGWYVYSNSDFLVVGRVLGKNLLGFYSIAWTLAYLPVDKITAMVTKVSGSYFASVQNDAVQQKRVFLRLTEGVFTLTLPACLGLSLVADTFIPVVLGSKWNAAVVPLQLLALYGAIRSVSTIPANLLLANRRSRYVMWTTLVAAAVMPPIFFAAATYGGITAVAAAWVFAYPAISFPIYRATFNEVGINMREYMEAISPSAASGFLMAIAVLCWKVMGSHLLPAAVSLAVQIALGAAVYSVSYYLLFQKRAMAFCEIVRTMRSTAN